MMRELGRRKRPARVRHLAAVLGISRKAGNTVCRLLVKRGLATRVRRGRYVATPRGRRSQA